MCCLNYINLHTNSFFGFRSLSFAHRFVCWHIYVFFRLLSSRELNCFVRIFLHQLHLHVFVVYSIIITIYKHTLVVRSLMFFSLILYLVCIYVRVCVLFYCCCWRERICLIVLCTSELYLSFLFSISQTVIIRIVLHFPPVALCTFTFIVLICLSLSCVPRGAKHREISDIRRWNWCSVCAFE